MQKIKDILIKRMFRFGLTKYQYITMFELIQMSNEQGRVNVYYKDIIKTVGCSNATFYNVINELEELGFIAKTKNDIYKAEIDITICGNDFLVDDYKNYVQTNIEFFNNKMYKTLSGGAIRTFLYLLFRVMKAKYSYDTTSNFHKRNKLDYNECYASIAKSIGVTKRMLKQYLNDLLKNKIISIGLEKMEYAKHKHDVITVAHSVLAKATVDITEKGKTVTKTTPALHSHFKHFIKNVCRRKNIGTSNERNIDDTAMLMTQYGKIVSQQGKNIYSIVTSALSQFTEQLLDSRRVHYIVKSLIDKNYNETLIVY